MKRKRTKALLLAVALVSGLALLLQPSRGQKAQAPEVNAMTAATEAYIYGYPLVLMEVTRQILTNIDVPNGKLAPMGQFANLRMYPAISGNNGVTPPKAGFFYSLAWLNVSEEPFVFRIPDAKGRHFSVAMLSGWADVFQAPHKNTTDTPSQEYVITGPGWTGRLPQGVPELKAPTSMVWIIGKTHCTGTLEDYKEVQAFQNQLSLVPLSMYGKPYTPPLGAVDPDIDMHTPVREQVNRMNAGSYFHLLAALIKDNPPPPDGAPIVARMARIGIVPGKDFKIGNLDPTVAKSLEDTPKAGVEIMADFPNLGTLENARTRSPQTANSGAEYLQGTSVTAIGQRILDADKIQRRDILCPDSPESSDGQPMIQSQTRRGWLGRPLLQFR
jgi:hypothetical protein